jgi:hypothetical protein
MANEVLRVSHGLTAREATIVADEILLLLEENFDAGLEESWRRLRLSVTVSYTRILRESFRKLIECLIRVWWLVWKS